MHRAGIFQYVAHRPLVRPGQVLVRLEYLSPALPHLTVFASVCRSWNAAVFRVTQHHNMADYQRLQLESQRRRLVCYWAHGPYDDRFDSRDATATHSQPRAVVCSSRQAHFAEASNARTETFRLQNEAALLHRACVCVCKRLYMVKS